MSGKLHNITALVTILCLFAAPAEGQPVQADVASDADRVWARAPIMDSPVLQEQIAAVDWAAVQKTLNSDSSNYSDPRCLLLAGHACHGQGLLNDAAGAFLIVRDTSALKAWLDWTTLFAQRQPDNHVSHYLLGDALARNGKLEEAEKEFTRALETDSDYMMACKARGVARDMLGKHEGARDDFEVARKANLKDADALANLGVYCLERNQLIAAEKLYSEAVNYDTSFGLAYNGLGCTHAALGKHAKAKDEFVAAGRGGGSVVYAAINAGAYADSSDSTSELGRLARAATDTSARGARVDPSVGGFRDWAWNIREAGGFFSGTISFLLDGGATFQESWDLGRGGVQLDVLKTDDIVLPTKDKPIKVGTDFLLAYPRPQEVAPPSNN